MKQVTSVNLIPLCILRILEKYSDAQSPVTQEELGELLTKEYGITCERKALGRTLHRMREELGLDIRIGRKGCWLENRVFTEQELFFLTGLVLSCRSIGEGETAVLLEKLCALSGINFGYRLKRQLKACGSAAETRPEKAENPEVLDTVGEVCDALGEGTMLGYRSFLPGNRHLSIIRSVSPLGLTLRGRSCCLLALEDDGMQVSEIPLEEMSSVHALDAPAFCKNPDAS
jgi:hypothetical protein